ncbi:hypothetical protein [Lentzea aerocolonigenes]|uniref:hypothetical protein n=1 Tax=Lentzea aerocolonigenes TaxID=68170 RepID=UPI001B80C3AA|nr:hypothetical protein [Lentzea aerocolonigenes]
MPRLAGLPSSKIPTVNQAGVARIWMSTLADVEGEPIDALANGAKDLVLAGYEVKSLTDRRLAQENWFTTLVAIAV